MDHRVKLDNRKFFRTSLKVTTGAAFLGAFAALVLVGCPAGGVGDPCTPEDEYREDFSGFDIREENIESRSFQCQTRLCLVNHFQGRVSCPQGQLAPTRCTDDSQCTGDKTCTFAGTNGQECPNGNADCPDTHPICDDNQCTARVCSAEEADDQCYVPGTQTPIAVGVCAQCGADSLRDADNSVYCSCRCDVGEGVEDDGSFNFCECPEGFACEEIRDDLGLGDKNLTGKFCIKQGTKFNEADDRCGTTKGVLPAGNDCRGVAASGT